MEKEKGKVIVGKIPYKFTSSYYRKVKFYLKSNKCEAFKTTKQTSIPFLSSNQSTSSGLDKNLLGNSSSELMITQTDDQTVNASFSTSFALHPGQNSNNDKILHEMFNNDEIINEYCVEDESNDEEYNIQEKQLSMMEELKNWSLQNRITHTAVSQLLVLLSKHGIKHLPKDCRTLLRTPRTIFIRQMGPSGEFWYGGIKQCLLRLCRMSKNPYKFHLISTLMDYLSVEVLSFNFGQYWLILLICQIFPQWLLLYTVVIVNLQV